ncbi:hypothetical protein [Streptomonospora arabica]|uniref:Uncharacterized protein n=1 Tax=Streptomonospora arabica TaxID=412417 RepID=A0ABV9SFM6_9ACTN
MQGVLDGRAFQGSFTAACEGSHTLPVRAEPRQAIAANPGEAVTAKLVERPARRAGAPLRSRRCGEAGRAASGVARAVGAGVRPGRRDPAPRHGPVRARSAAAAMLPAASRAGGRQCQAWRRRTEGVATHAESPPFAPLL